jgi:tRNA-dihydrouridine synthase
MEINKRWFDWIMIGQWAIGNPRVFTKYQPSLNEKIETIKSHLTLMITTEFRFEKYIKKMEWYSFQQPNIEDLKSLEKNIDYNHPYHSIVEFRKYFFQYLKGIPCSREIKQWILQKKTFNEVSDILSLLNNN